MRRAAARSWRNEDKGFYSAIQSCRHRISRRRVSDLIEVRFKGNGA